MPPIRRYRATPVPSPADLHLLRRFSFGYTPALRAEAAAAGGARSWFEQQLAPSRISDPRGQAVDGWFPLLAHSPRTAFENQKSGRVHRNHYTWSIARRALLRQTYSSRQVHEVMTEFWLNHLHVYAQASPAWPFRPGYDEVVRHHALGRFTDLLAAAVTHPAMLRYLDADSSVAGEINENLGRELLELHTLGRESGYSEVDVRNAAKVLTGLGVDRITLQPVWNERDHERGLLSVLGISVPNLLGSGRDAIADLLARLAVHPATARRIATKLAVRFVADDPPAALVDRVAEAFLSSGTSIPATLRALVDDPLFRAAAQPKVRTPMEDVVATLRALEVTVGRPGDPGDGAAAANAVLWLTTSVGQRPWHWVTPDGFPDRSEAWASASRMLASFRVHHNLAGGYYPRERVTYRPAGSRLPRRRMRFDTLTDHLSRTLRGRPVDARTLAAACRYLEVSPGTVITRSHPVVRWRMPWLLALLLDSPEHMTR
ncbi:DUF1800 domain-containing protein [Nocardioidaceae bacterium]|nr:DUF1800 domain-containing protein [Nocardioidaceae bacterium]